jgi:hypothetical protein
MGGVVAEDTKAVKEIGYLRRHNPFKPQAAKQIGLGFIVRLIKACLGRDELGQQFGELAKFDEAVFWSS